MDWRDHIERNPKVMRGKPVIKGTRITVELLLEMLSAGSDVDDILTSYPHLTSEQVRAALAYAADSIATEKSSFSIRRRRELHHTIEAADAICGFPPQCKAAPAGAGAIAAAVGASIRRAEAECIEDMHLPGRALVFTSSRGIISQR